MSNGDTQNNCVLEVCCGGPDDVDKQTRALKQQIVAHVAGVSQHDVALIAAWLVSAYDFAEKGTLYAFKQSIVRLAKTEPYHE